MKGHTVQLFQDLELRRIAEILDEEPDRATKTGPSYETLLARLLKEEERNQIDRAREVRIRRAKLPARWAMETFPYAWQSGVQRRIIEQLASFDVLAAADEMGYLDLRPDQTSIFFKLMDQRHREKSTIITTNLGYRRWPGFLGNKEMKRAFLERLRQECVTIDIQGPSLRGDRIEFQSDAPTKDQDE